MQAKPAADDFHLLARFVRLLFFCWVVLTFVSFLKSKQTCDKVQRLANCVLVEMIDFFGSFSQSYGTCEYIYVGLEIPYKQIPHNTGLMWSFKISCTVRKQLVANIPPNVQKRVFYRIFWYDKEKSWKHE